jgi:predicted anti-sigma-YlaC factor YlaD
LSLTPAHYSFSEINMLTCREVTELANAYLDGELRLMTRLQMRVHLMMCKHCPKYIDQLASTTKLLRALPSDAPSSDVEEKILRLLKDNDAAGQE